MQTFIVDLGVAPTFMIVTVEKKMNRFSKLFVSFALVMGLTQLMPTASACVPSCRSDHLNLLCEKRGNPFFLMKKTAFRQSSEM